RIEEDEMVKKVREREERKVVCVYFNNCVDQPTLQSGGGIEEDEMVKKVREREERKVVCVYFNNCVDQPTLQSGGTVKFGNDQIVPILRYGDLIQGAITIKRVYYVEGLNHNLFFVGQFCDADLEVAFRKSTCYIRDLKGNDLLIASSSQAWLWHRRLSHLNFDTINLLSQNDIVVGLPKLKFIKDHLCSSCELGKAKRKSKDKTPEVLIDFLRLVQRGIQAQVRIVRTDKGTEVLNQTLHAYFAAEGIHHQTSVARTPEQNGVVERQNCDEGCKPV
nr:hypothetical protein [Tanacetum cinerariifolium]